MERICEVIVDIAHANVDRLYSYLVPEGMLVAIGSHVLVPFGNGNRQRRPDENRQDAQNHCLLGEQVEASHASCQNNQRQRKLDLVSHDVRDL